LIEKIVIWIIENREWVFSGIGVIILSVIVRKLSRLKFSKLIIIFFYLLLFLFTYLFFFDIEYFHTIKKRINNYYDYSVSKITFPEYDSFIKCDSTIFLIEKSGYWGVANIDGSIIINPQFNSIKCFESGIAIASKEDRYGIINLNNELFEPFIYDKIYGNKNDILKFKKDNRVGIKINNKENYINYSSIIEGNGSKFFVKENYWSLVDTNLNKLSNLEFQDVVVLGSSHFLAKKSNLWGLVDFDSNILIPFKMASITKKYHKILEVKDLGEIYYTNFDGARFDKLGVFSENLISAKRNDKWGYISPDGQIIIEFEFEKAYPFDQGIAVVKKGNRYVRVDKSGVCKSLFWRCK